MASATLDPPTAHPSIDAGQVVGIVRGGRPRPAGYPAGTTCWTLTSDLADLARGDDEFLPCGSRAEAEERLAALFPAPHPDLARAVPLTAGTHWSKKHNRHVPTRTGTIVVFPLPRLAEVFGNHGPPYDGGAAGVTRLLDLVAAHGPLLIPRDAAERLRGRDAFAASDLVIAQEPGCDHATVKFAPSKSQARRTRAANTEIRQAEAQALAKAAATMRARIDDLSRAIRQDLDALGLGAALPEFTDSHTDDDWEPIRYESHRRGWRGHWSGRSYRNDRPPRRSALMRLAAVCLIHARFRGKAAYRRLPQWGLLRKQFAGLPAALEPARWGLVEGRKDLALFWSREVAARAPRPRPPAIVRGCPDCGYEATEREFANAAEGGAPRCPLCDSANVRVLEEPTPYAAGPHPLP